jgi:hypothetical protein
MQSVGLYEELVIGKQGLDKLEARKAPLKKLRHWSWQSKLKYEDWVSKKLTEVQAAQRR